MRGDRSGCASCARSSTSSKATDTSASDQPAASHSRSLGILGGTFNPPHLGHLALARRAFDELGLDRVVLMPAHTPPHKGADGDPGPEHRLRMSELLIDDEPGLAACALEIKRGGPSYTVDTLDAIHASHPDAELTFIVGADAARTLADWRDPEKLLELADLAVAARSGSSEDELLQTVARLAAGTAPASPATAKLRFLDMPLVEISSSQARRRAARGEPLEDLVGPAVADYIADHRLYRQAAETTS
jgi:nicotinate-nucleotide adenylyltransferase